MGGLKRGNYVCVGGGGGSRLSYVCLSFIFIKFTFVDNLAKLLK